MTHVDPFDNEFAYDGYDESEDCPTHGGVECEPDECKCDCNYCEGFRVEVEEDEDDNFGGDAD